MLNLNHNMLSGNINSSLQGAGRELSGTAETYSTRGAEPSAAKAGTAALNNMNVGDVFNGEIVDIHNHDVTIKLNDNSVVNAFLKQALQMNIGQKIIFQVKEKSDNQIFIRPMEDKGISSDLINKSLSGAGLSLNAKNSAIVSALINVGQPIDRQSVIGYLKLTNQYGLENIDKLIEMNKHGLSISEENLTLYDKYAQSQHQLSEYTDRLQGGLEAYIEEIFQGAGEEMQQGVGGLTELLQNLADIYEQSEANATLMDAEMADGQNINAEAMKEETVNAQKGEAASTNSEVILTSKGETTAANAKMISDENNNQIKEASAAEENRTKVTLAQSETMEANEKSAHKSGSSLLRESARSLSELAGSINDGSADREVIKAALQSVKEHIKEGLTKHLRLNIGELAKDSDKLKEQTQQLYEKLSKTTELIKNALPSEKGQSLQEAANDLKNNLSFMNELNHMGAYVQLPVKMSMNDANGDLYVYNRKKGKSNGDEPLTAFLHLDLEHLGATDVHISLKQQSVTVGFTLEGEESFKLVKSHLAELAERLEKKGYQAVLKAEQEVIEKGKAKEPVSALLPIMKNDENATSIKRYSFDLKA